MTIKTVLFVLCLMVNFCNPSTLEAKAGEPGLYITYFSIAVIRHHDQVNL